MRKQGTCISTWFCLSDCQSVAICTNTGHMFYEHSIYVVTIFCLGVSLLTVHVHVCRCIQICLHDCYIMEGVTIHWAGPLEIVQGKICNGIGSQCFVMDQLSVCF